MNYDNTKLLNCNKRDRAKIYYNPSQDNSPYKYHNALYMGNFVLPHDSVHPYMLINEFDDFLRIKYSMHSHYALSQNISLKNNPHNSFGNYYPVAAFYRSTGEQIPFSGNLDGNGYSISAVNIILPTKNKVGLFSYCAGSEVYHSTIENLILENITISGQNHIGCLCGVSKNVNIENIYIEHSAINGSQSLGILVGTAINNIISSIDYTNISSVYPDKVNNTIVGTAINSQVLSIENYSEILGLDLNNV